MSRHASTVDLLGDADAEADREDARSGDGEDDPGDRWGLCYLIFLLAGAGTMFPWNVFITERAYFDVRLFAPPFTPALANSFESVFGMAYLLTNACAQYAMVVTRIANRLSPKAMLPAPLFAMAGGLALTGCVTYARHMSGDATMALTLITLLVLGVLFDHEMLPDKALAGVEGYWDRAGTACSCASASTLHLHPVFVCLWHTSQRFFSQANSCSRWGLPFAKR